MAAPRPTATSDTPPEAAVHRTGKELQQRVATSGQPTQPMPASQAEMRVKPDCGETSYRGSGRLAGKRVLLTGGDSGIGRAVAIAFAREGADLAIVYHSHDEDARDTARLVAEAGRRCELLKGDVGDPSWCAAAVERAVAALGGLDCLINNAGVQYREEGGIEACDFGRLEEAFKTNVFSNFYLAKAALPHLTPGEGEPPRGSTIIFNTSINAAAGNAALVSYSASKGAQQALMRSLAKSLTARGVRCNAVAPGPVWTPFITGSFPPGPEGIAEFGSGNPMGRAAQPAEVAPAFVYLASSESSYVAAATLHVDGGQFTSS